jgi:hypothetical protein
MLKITLEGGIEDIEGLLGDQEDTYPDIVLMGKHFSLISCDIHRWIGAGDIKVVFFGLPNLNLQEEAVAEDAVRKAKESLEAAEATLKKIKEKK